MFRLIYVIFIWKRDFQNKHVIFWKGDNPQGGWGVGIDLMVSKIGGEASMFPPHPKKVVNYIVLGGSSQLVSPLRIRLV